MKHEYLNNCKECNVEIQRPRRMFCTPKCKNLYNHKTKYKYKYQVAFQVKSPKHFLQTLINKKNGRSKDGLTKENLFKIYEKQKGLCAITKLPMTMIRFGGKVPTNISMDRIDNSRGYELENVQLVCRIVNVMKLDQTMDELKLWCQRILDGIK